VSDRPKAVILVVGDELVLGETRDSNGAHMAASLHSEGCEVLRMQAVRDVEAEIIRALREGVADAEVVMVSGGLGPTEDDRTRQAIGAVAGVALVESAQLREIIDGLYRRLNRTPLERVYSQALLPEGAVIFDNPVGSAQGFGVKTGSTWIIATAGVPGEFLATFDNAVLAFLRDNFKDCLEHTEQLVLRVHGLSESEVNERLREHIREDANPMVRLTVSDGIIGVRLSATGPNATELLAALRKEAGERLGDFVFGTGDETFASVVVKIALERSIKIAVAESCTGGLIGDMLTECAGVSGTLMLDAVTYSNEAKINILGVEPELIASEGAVSEAVVRRMARGVREKAGADFAVAVTGIAGPSGGTSEKPVGLVWIAVSGLDGEQVREHHFRPPRNSIRRRSALYALSMLRACILKTS